MPSSKPIPFTDISFLEKLTKQNIFQTLLNVALYLSFSLPLVEKIQFPVINSPWKNVSNEIALVFLFSGFGFVYWVSGRHVRFWLISIRLNLEFGFKIVSAWLRINSNRKKSVLEIYFDDKDLVSKSDLISYLSRNENKFLEKLYSDRMEMDAKYNLNQENTVATFLLLFLHWCFKSQLYLNFSQYLPALLPISILILLCWYSAEPFPEDNDYFYIKGNSIRDFED